MSALDDLAHAASLGKFSSVQGSGMAVAKQHATRDGREVPFGTSEIPHTSLVHVFSPFRSSEAVNSGVFSDVESLAFVC